MRARGRSLVLLTVGALLAADLAGAGPEPRSASRVRLANLRSAGAVERALRGARRRLAQPRCGAIVSAFRDARGRLLSEELAALGTTAEAHLDSLFFYDGQQQPVCQRDTAPLAFTHVGSRVVYVCARFAEAERRDRLLAEAALIHESLHTLGLGENPPSSSEITARVLSVCRR